MSRLPWTSTAFTRALKIKYPIIQAPCAGHAGSELTAAISNAGGLGSLGLATTQPEIMREIIRDTRSKTSLPFAVNLFCRPTPPPSRQELQAQYPTDTFLDNIRHELGIPRPPQYALRSPPLDSQAAVIIEEGVLVVSYTFGYLPDHLIKAFKDAGIYLIGTATTVQEALFLAGENSEGKPKADAIVAQGLEAGGHRGSFLATKGKEMPTKELVQNIRGALASKLPVLAAGGISNGATAADALLKWDADGVVIGSLFMLAKESRTPPAHRKVMLTSQEPTQLTKVVTGRYARCFPNKLVQTIENSLGTLEVPSYDIQSAKTTDIVTHATKNSLTDYMYLLAGENTAKAAEFSENGSLSGTEIFNKLVSDIQSRA
ncbi:2-nitropropane dioxygenase [Phycomyces nitens]|nr:2-nitropropane dioxygenase [Phycomyces nitens]